MAKRKPELQDLGTDGLALMVTIMQHNNNDASWTLSAVADSYRRSLALSQAELTLVRNRLRHLLAGPYQPSTDALRDALWPSQEEIENLAASLEKGL